MPARRVAAAPAGGYAPAMRSLAEIAVFIEREPEMMRLLGAVERCGLRDGWIGAGFVRNTVWDALHGRDVDCARLDDVDVIFFDPADARPERDRRIEQELRALCPGVPWSVKNQARMHRRNGDAPYADTADALRHWPETATAIAACSRGRRVELTAPHGIDDLVGLIVRPTPAFAAKPALFRARAKAKDWRTRWPRLTVIERAAGPSRLATRGPLAADEAAEPRPDS